VDDEGKKNRRGNESQLEKLFSISERVTLHNGEAEPDRGGGGVQITEYT